MNTLPHERDNEDSNSVPEHGTEKSYIIGFLLSLIFTIIPYKLVVNHSLTGNALLALILGIAVIQMIIQVVFFLHLGRERKPRWQLYFFSGTVIGILTVVVGSIFIMQHLHYNMNPTDTTQKLSQNEAIYQVGGAKTGACKVIHAEHTITIRNGVPSPAHTEAGYCDALIFINEDATERVIAFGAHPQHVPYAGQDELTVRKGSGKMLILSADGTYQFHDHLDSTVAGSFTVTQ